MFHRSPGPATAFALLALLPLLGACSGGSEADAQKGGNAKGGARGPRQVGFVTVTTTSVPLVTQLGGHTVAFETSEVRPQVNGLVQRRLFTEGSFVRQGQPLYQIDPSLYRAAVNEASASVASARAAADAAQARANRFRPLAQIEAVSQQEYTDARAAASQGAAAVAQNRALLDSANINLRYTRVAAPSSGRIGRSLVTTGALVTASQAEPLATIQRLDPIYVDIQQSSAQLLALRRALAGDGPAASSAQVRLRLEDGSDYGQVGTLQFAEATVDPETGTVTLRARFPNPDGLLLPGMFVRASFVQRTVAGAILVPQAALSRTPEGVATVLVIGPGNKAVQRRVQAERTYNDQWVVTGGLRPGERVITEGLGFIQPGATVIPVPAGSPPRARPAAAGGQQKAS